MQPAARIGFPRQPALCMTAAAVSTSSLSPLTCAEVHFGADHVLFPLVALHSG